jgi:hypothetical protein
LGSDVGDGFPERRQLGAVRQRDRVVECAKPAFLRIRLSDQPLWSAGGGGVGPSILFSRDTANASRSRVTRSWCALKFETRSRISSRADLGGLTGGSSMLARGVGGSGTMRGVEGSTRLFFTNAMVSSISASKSAFQLVIVKPLSELTAPDLALPAPFEVPDVAAWLMDRQPLLQ